WSPDFEEKACHWADPGGTALAVATVIAQENALHSGWVAPGWRDDCSCSAGTFFLLKPFSCSRRDGMALRPLRGVSARAVSVALVAVFLTAATGTALAQLAAPPPAPPLPPPSGPTVSVSSVSELEAAVDALTSGTTILVQPGVYQLDQTLIISNGVTGVS